MMSQGKYKVTFMTVQHEGIATTTWKVEDGLGIVIATAVTERAAHMIVEVLNGYDDLLTACKSVHSYCRRLMDEGSACPLTDVVWDPFDAAIAKAKGIK
jgi:ActR/RegA family two-component response regulator